MPNIVIRTSVNQTPKQVWYGFDLQLFEALKPPVIPLKVLRFDGCETGDEVHLQLGPEAFAQNWQAKIIDHGQKDGGYYFVDTGKVLPPPLSTWTHRHLMLPNANGGTDVIDNITYSTGNSILDWIIYPVMYLQFAARGPIYKKYFA